MKFFWEDIYVIFGVFENFYTSKPLFYLHKVKVICYRRYLML